MGKKKLRRDPDQKRRDPALQLAIDAAGGAASLAKALGITEQAVCLWKKCPPRRAPEIEKATKGIVKRERLCPELYE